MIAVRGFLSVALAHAGSLVDPERITLTEPAQAKTLPQVPRALASRPPPPYARIARVGVSHLHPETPAPSAELELKFDRMNRVAQAAPEFVTPVVENHLGCPISEASTYVCPKGGVWTVLGTPPRPPRSRRVTECRRRATGRLPGS